MTTRFFSAVDRRSVLDSRADRSARRAFPLRQSNFGSVRIRSGANRTRNLARAVCLLLLALSMSMTACRRERPALDGVNDGGGSQSNVSESAASIEHASPASGAVLQSPIQMKGRADIGEGQALIAVVYSVDERDESKWRGNRLLELDAEGNYDNEVGYKIPIDSPGYIEIGVLDAASGTIVHRERIMVELIANQ